jgi:hypothetical protein
LFPYVESTTQYTPHRPKTVFNVQSIQRATVGVGDLRARVEWDCDFPTSGFSWWWLESQSVLLLFELNLFLQIGDLDVQGRRYFPRMTHLCVPRMTLSRIAT